MEQVLMSDETAAVAAPKAYTHYNFPHVFIPQSAAKPPVAASNLIGGIVVFSDGMKANIALFPRDSVAQASLLTLFAETRKGFCFWKREKILVRSISYHRLPDEAIIAMAPRMIATLKHVCANEILRCDDKTENEEGREIEAAAAIRKALVVIQSGFDLVGVRVHKDDHELTQTKALLDRFGLVTPQTLSSLNVAVKAVGADADYNDMMPTVPSARQLISLPGIRLK